MTQDQSPRQNAQGQATPGGDPRDTPGIINVQAALNRMGHDRQLLADVALFFLEDAPPLVAQLDAAWKARDGKDIAQAAHTLKGLASNFDAHYVQTLSAEIESQGFQNQLEGIDSKIASLGDEVDRAIEAMKKEILENRP